MANPAFSVATPTGLTSTKDVTPDVALSRATDLTVLACPLNMHGLEGAAQVIAALLHGACALHTIATLCLALPKLRGPLKLAI